jgi:hypothetical protein
MSDPKNQHTIPKCYLKQFIDPKVPSNFGPCVWIFARKSKSGRRQNIRSVLTQTDIYTFKGDYSIEKSLAQLESEYAEIFEKKIKNKLPLTTHEHAVFCAFVAAMLQRTLKQKDHIEDQMDNIIGWAKQLETLHGAPPKSSLEWEAAKQDAHKLSLIEMVPEIANILTKMNLAFLCTKSRKVKFITSDSPAYLFNSRMQFMRWYSPGFGQKHVEVRMPLSPQISVCFSWVNNLRGYLYVPEERVHEDNRMVYGYSHEYFIANSARLKRRWFRRIPLRPSFLLKYLRHQLRAQVIKMRHKYHA